MPKNKPAAAAAPYDPMGTTMDGRAILMLPVPYSVDLIFHRGRTIYQETFRTDAPIELRMVAPELAPVCIDVRWPATHVPRAMTWRSFEGGFWRPFLDPVGRAIVEPGRFEGIANDPRTDGWTDYPFRNPGRYGSTSPFRYSRDLPVGCRVVENRRDETMAAAQDLAERTMIVVDGVIHRQSAPPVYGVGKRSDTMGTIEVCLTEPDICKEECLALFALDQMAEAQAFARWLATECPPRGRRGPRAISRRPLAGTALTFQPGPTLPEERSRGVIRTYDAICSILKSVTHRETSFVFLQALVELGLVVEALREAPDRPALVALLTRARRAVEVIIEEIPTGGDPYRWTKRLEMVTNAFLHHAEILGDPPFEAPDDEDMEALAGALL
jgi:hypothetical protein